MTRSAGNLEWMYFLAQFSDWVLDISDFLGLFSKNDEN